ncbi:MAG TPA: NUDIX hydrolase [Mesorhizobium sp.]|nr:NUDIX hydrolase [Mesorhizobium sp.]
MEKIGFERPETDRLNPADKAPPGRALRPRDAGTLLILDRSGPELRVLMGRRNAGLAFMAGRFVFPGGRTDAGDARMASADELNDREVGRISPRPARARAVAMSALREAWEEAGVVLGQPCQEGEPPRRLWDGYARAGVLPRLSTLRLVARAVTPPGAVRRFDTRFLALWRDELVTEAESAGGELEALGWLSLDETAAFNLAEITRIVLDDLRQRLSADPDLLPGGPAFFYRARHGRFVREPV